MASINFGTKEINCKIVYYGPGLCGKTTNLQIVHHRLPASHKSDMVSLATDSDRTIFFDFLPLDLGAIKGFRTRFQLYTVPGQVYYNSTRKLVLKGVDGLVMVMDSQRNRHAENMESLENLRQNLEDYGISLDQIPLVFQYNKRDLSDLLTVDEMQKHYNLRKVPFVESAAGKGVGVIPTLKTICKSVMESLNKKQKLENKSDSRSKTMAIPAISKNPVSSLAESMEDLPVVRSKIPLIVEENQPGSYNIASAQIPNIAAKEAPAPVASTPAPQTNGTAQPQWTLQTAADMAFSAQSGASKLNVSSNQPVEKPATIKAQENSSENKEESSNRLQKILIQEGDQVIELRPFIPKNRST